MILLAKQVCIDNSDYVIVCLDNGREWKTFGTLHGYTDTTVAIERKNITYVYNENEQVIFKYPDTSKYAKDDLEILLDINQ